MRLRFAKHDAQIETSSFPGEDHPLSRPFVTRRQDDHVPFPDKVESIFREACR